MSPTTAEQRELVLALEPRPESARAARRALAARGLPEDVGQATALMVTELVGNAVRHARLSDDERIAVHARVRDDVVRVEVADPGPGFDPHQPDHGGYGFRLVQELSSRWGVDMQHGCRVWFEVDRRPPRFARG